MKSLLILLSLVSSAAFGNEAPERVVVPLGEFLKLYETAKNRPDKPETAPTPFAVASARYNGEVTLRDGEPASVLFSARFRVEVLKDKGWVKIPLLPADVAVQRAVVGGQEAAVVLEGGRYALVTDRRGAFDVDVTFAVSVTNAQGLSQFSFPLTPSGATAVTLTVPASDKLDFTVANARLMSDRVVAGKRVLDATLTSTGNLAVSWQRDREETEQKLDPRVYTEVHTLVAVGEGLLTAESTVHHTILHQGVDKLRIAVPKALTLVDVGGTGIRDWTRGDDGVVEVQLSYAAEGSYTLSLQLEQALAAGATPTVPLVQPLGVERSKGFVGVQARGTMEVQPGTVRGAVPVDVRTLPAAIGSASDIPVLLGFKYFGDQAAIPLTIAEYEEVDVLVTLLDQATGVTMVTPDGRRLTSVTWQVRNNRRQFLRLELPAGAELWSASVAGRSVQPARDNDGRLLLPLVRSQSSGGALSAFDVSVVYIEEGSGRQGRKLTFEADLPRADAPTTWVGWEVFVPNGSKIVKKSAQGTVPMVGGLSRPARASQVLQVDGMSGAYQQSAEQQARRGDLGSGAAPVQVTMPIEGTPQPFEKLLALGGERLWVGFTVTKLPK